VAGLNPHAGDGGNFGREEIDVIAPVVEAGKRDGIRVEGPFPADTVFLRAKTVGFPFPICTPAHGTAYDIAGRGVASVGAIEL
jgi:4-hydroxythreonine-4-phosphate dehydrogenase